MIFPPGPLDPIIIFLATLSVMSAIIALESRQIVYGAVSLIVMFLGISAIFLYLGGLYLGVVQLGVYVGAIGVLILFAVILVGESRTPEPNVNRIIGATAAMIVLGSLLVGFTALQMLPAPHHVGAQELSRIASRLMRDYGLVIVALGSLLASTAFGSVMITRR